MNATEAIHAHLARAYFRKAFEQQCSIRIGSSTAIANTVVEKQKTQKTTPTHRDKLTLLEQFTPNSTWWCCSQCRTFQWA